MPHVALSTDIISGFCGESEAEHGETLALLREAHFEQAYLFAYSRRERTHAAYKLADDVPEETKQRRLAEAIAVFRAGAAEANAAEAGRLQLVLVEAAARRSTAAAPQLGARTSSGKRVILADVPLAEARARSGGAAAAAAAPPPPRRAVAGDYVLARVTAGGAASLQAEALLLAPGGLLDLPALRAAAAPELLLG